VNAMATNDNDRVPGSLPEELARRSFAGIDVTILWSSATNIVSVAVDDEPAGNHFELVVDDDANVLEVFRHPYAYAAWRGVDFNVVDTREAA
jgi:hypothetical protein